MELQGQQLGKELKWDTDPDINICFDTFILLIFLKASPAVQAQTAKKKMTLRYACATLDGSVSYTHVK